MNTYALQQLARQRQAAYRQEAERDRLVRLARDAARRPPWLTLLSLVRVDRLVRRVTGHRVEEVAATQRATPHAGGAGL